MHAVIINLYVKYDLEDMYAHTQDTHTHTHYIYIYIDTYTSKANLHDRLQHLHTYPPPAGLGVWHLRCAAVYSSALTVTVSPRAAASRISLPCIAVRQMRTGWSIILESCVAKSELEIGIADLASCQSMNTTSLVTLSLHHAVCLRRAEGEVYQVCEDAKVNVGPVWKVCKERFTQT
jgi:hypothetical protein